MAHKTIANHWLLTPSINRNEVSPLHIASKANTFL